MNAQQANIDNVAHNLANVNTTGFKKSRVEFEDLVYQQLKAPGTSTSQETEAPVGLEAGLGSRPVATARNFTSGNLRATNSPLDLAIEGQGFLQVTLTGGRDRLHASRHSSSERRGPARDRRRLLDRAAITIPPNAVTVTISKDGIVSVKLADQHATQQVGNIELANFQNPAGLMARAATSSSVTTASGDAVRRAFPALTVSALWRRGSSRTPTSAWSKRWST